MAGDYTRLTLDPLRDRAMVLEQQGRVHLDADFNELAGIIERRLRVETRDVVGPAVYPVVEPDGFKIDIVANGVITIGRGRMYVDGLMPENHGTGKLGVEPVWDERRYEGDTPMSKQPYLGTVPASPPFGVHSGKPTLIYLDVWQRELTAVEDPSIVEPALGVDTCTRVQTAWQVRALDLPVLMGCGRDWSKHPPWKQLIQPSAGRLSSAATKPPAPSDPCAVAPVGGYRGLENRLYRVEIHDPGAAGTATLKWSRDNGAVAARVTAITAGPQPIVTVERLGRDDVLRFHAGEWVELLDDVHELDGQPGVMGQVLETDSTQSTVTLAAALAGPIDVTRNARLRRWDQTAGVTAAGVVALPALPATVALEDGIEVELSLADPSGTFHSGDWWVFAARAATASVEELDDAPPRGVRHHFARLAVISSAGTIEDCRVPWPGKCDCDPAEGSCGCEACVTPESHGDGQGPLTIQDAIDSVIAAGGGRVCLAPGEYVLPTRLTISNARSLTLIGAGSATLLVSEDEAVGILVEDSVEVSLERFALLAGAARGLTGTPPIFVDSSGMEIAIALINTLDCRVQRCFVVEGFDGEHAKATVGIGLGGWALRTRLLDNVVLADVAIGDVAPGRAQTPPPPPDPGSLAPAARPVPVGRGPAAAYATMLALPTYLATADLAIEDNLLLGIRFGIDFGQSALSNSGPVTSPRVYGSATRIERNCVLGGGDAGISLLGVVMNVVPIVGPLGGLPRVDELARLLQRVAVVTVADNVVSVTGDGIRADVDELRVERNTLRGAGAKGDATLLSGIRVDSSLDRQDCSMRLCDNTITEFNAAGIDVISQRCSVQIAGNRLTQLGRVGISAQGRSSEYQLPDLRIDDNVLARVGLSDGGILFGIIAMACERVTVCRNLLRSLMPEPTDVSRGVALSVGYCSSVQIQDNQFVGLGPDGDYTGRMFGISAGGFDALDVAGNTVQLGGGDSTTVAFALRIGDEADLDTARKHVPGAKDKPPLGLPELLIRGNLLSSPAVQQPAVLVAGKFGVTISDNRCRSLLKAHDKVPIVFVSAPGATIVASNRVAGPSSDSPAVELHVPVSNSPPCTVVGNVTSGAIELNLSPLQPPWDALNILS